MGEEIRREINQAPFVAVMVDETTDVGNTAQLALVVRYVTVVAQCFDGAADICQQRLPRVAPTRWQYSSRLVNMVFEKRAALPELFVQILEHLDEFDDESNRKLDVQFCLKRVDEFCDTTEREKGRFADIFESTQFEAYRKKFPDSAFSSLTQSHGSLFDDVTRLKTELIVMYAMADDEETQLARLSSLASMVIEKDLLLELKRTDVTLLYNRVIELFVNKEMRMGFVLK
ncbi:hypothetical protein VZT92_009362 [Zoarces viviparus]|uniref:DUF4371 domain-containing protein n=1 Tax=Zoarces viviparus TaxID=48416 RepID=A0AAW1FIR1_ZOAVI